MKILALLLLSTLSASATLKALVAGDTLELQGWANSATPTFGMSSNSGESEVYSTIEFARQ